MISVMLQGIVTKQFKVIYVVTSYHPLRLSVCLSLTANDINREPTGALGTEITPRETMVKRERERDGIGGESKLVLQYFSSPADTRGTPKRVAFSDISTRVTIWCKYLSGTDSDCRFTEYRHKDT